MKFNLADNEPFLVEGSSKSVNVLDLITTETDPVFLASAAANITTSDISNWDSKVSNVQADWDATSGAAEILHKPDILEVVELYNNDSTGLLATSNYSLTFQTDISSFDLIRCYFRSSAHNVGDSNAIPAGILYINLSEEAALSSGEYPGSVSIPYLNNTNRYASYVCLINSTKTQFKVVSQQSLYGTAATNISDASHGIYCYRIEGLRVGGVTSGEGGGGSSTFVEMDPVFSASPAANITSSDISNWNSKTDNVGTITGITMNNTSKGTSGVVDLGTVITSETPLSKGTTTGSGNVVTDISVSGHQITLTKGNTFVTSGDLSAYATDLVYNNTRGTIELLHERNTIASIDVTPFVKDGMVSSVTVGTPSSGINVGITCLIITFNTDAGQNQIELPISQIFNASDYYTKTDIDNAGYITSIKTINNNTITGTGNINIEGLPAVTSTDNGKILRVADGAWTLVDPVTLYSGTGTPNNSQGNNGDLYMQI